MCCKRKKGDKDDFEVFGLYFKKTVEKEKLEVLDLGGSFNVTCHKAER